jgi:hypothetical protein
MAEPYEHQLQAARRIMRYLSQTAHYSPIFGSDDIEIDMAGPRAFAKSTHVSGFSDSDYGECKQTRRSTSGCLVLFNGDIIHWFSRKQKLVVTSSTEAEYVALGETVKELLWCRSWLSEVYQEEILAPMTIYEDNRATIQLAQHGDMISQRTKHIDIKYHFLRQYIDDGTIKLMWVESKNQLADILTKPLQGGTFKYICDKILETAC